MIQFDDAAKADTEAMDYDLDDTAECAPPQQGLPPIAPAPLDLSHLQFASPCEVPWGSMEGDGAIRFCRGCEKHVYFLSEMPRVQAEAILRGEHPDGLCVRIYRRPDGTVLAGDCPVGVAARVRRRLVGVASLIAAGVLALVFGDKVRQRLMPAAETPEKKVAYDSKHVGVGFDKANGHCEMGNI